jgi:hypothetical protein
VGIGIIEKSAIEGQKAYHADLDHAMRNYIHQHQSEFVPAGVDPAVLPDATPAEDAPAAIEVTSPIKSSLEGVEEERKQRERERNQRGLQWAWETFEGASSVARRSTRGALELVAEAWEQSTSTTICILLIVVLVLSNVWTLVSMGGREEVGRKKEMMRVDERERWVQGVVTALWEELAAKGVPGSAHVAGGGVAGVGESSAVPAGESSLPPPQSPNWREEVAELAKTLDAVEERVQLIRNNLNSLD